jgi:acyl-CoA synthetase (AMP-forming)/AMP-acid ligase II
MGLLKLSFHLFGAEGEIDCRPNSIGKAIPNAEVLVLRQDGTHCVPGEPGELVHRGATVALGYWGDHEKQPGFSGLLRRAKMVCH